MCRAEIKSKLINPETVEFYEFRDLTSSEYLRLLSAGNEEGSGRLTTPENQKTAEEVMAKLQKTDPSAFHTVRVRAEGGLGNKVTSQMLCMSNKTECICSDPVADARHG